MAQIILLTDVSWTFGYGKYGGTYKIATEIRKHGYSCQVIDNIVSIGVDRLPSLIDKFVDEETFMLGISTTLLSEVSNPRRNHVSPLFWGMPMFNNVLMHVNKTHPNIKIVVGGANIDLNFSRPFIDYGIQGKADNAVIELIKHITTGSDIKFRQNELTKVIRGDDYFYTPAEFEESAIIFQPEDIVFDNEALPIEVARGCIFQCGFCKYDLIGKRIGDWTKTGDALRREFMRNYELFGVTKYMVTDELVNESVGKLEMLCEVVESLPFKISYSAYVRADLIYKYPEMIDLLARSGADSLTFGIETLNHTAGKIIGKGLHPDKVKQVLAECKKAWGDNILMSSGFIIGLPGEDEESIWRTVDYLVSPDCPLDVFQIHPLAVNMEQGEGIKKSKFEEDLEKYGFKKSGHKGPSSKFMWTSEHGDMSYSYAKELTGRVLSDPRVRERTKLRSATYLGRIFNLGYTKEDIFNCLRNETVDKFENDLKIKMAQKKQEYYLRLLNL